MADGSLPVSTPCPPPPLPAISPPPAPASVPASAPGGRTYASTDLMFSNGVRVFVPIEVDVDGRREARTIVMSQVAAASNSRLAFLISEEHSFRRFVGGEVAKRLLFEAKQRGWTIR